MDLLYFCYQRFGIFIGLRGIGFTYEMRIYNSVSIWDLGVALIYCGTVGSAHRVVLGPYAHHIRLGLVFKLFGVGIVLCALGRQTTGLATELLEGK